MTESDPGTARADRGASNSTARLVDGLGVLLIAATIVWVVDIPRLLRIPLFTEQMMAVGLGLALAMLFLMRAADGREPARVAWWDVLLSVASLIGAGYLALRYPSLVNEVVYRPLDGVLLGGGLALLTMEGVRRSTGWALAIILGLFVALALLGHHLPEAFATRRIAVDRLAVYLGLDTNALIGLPLKIGITVILPFLVLGAALSLTGGAAFFSDLAMALMGRYRGGGAKIAVVGSTLFGSINGSAVANVASTGILTIPLMQRSGMSRPLSGAVEAVASTGGQLMPPVMGAAAFLMAELLQIGYGEVLLAALVPILLYYAALFVQIDLLAARLGLSGIPRERRPPAGPTLKAGWHFLLPFAVIIGGIFWLNMRPEITALYATLSVFATSLIFGYKGRRPGLGTVWTVAARAGRTSVEIILITGGAGLVIGILNLTGFAFSLTIQLVAMSGGSSLLLLLIAAILSIILGMGMPTAGVYILLATLIAPALIQAGIAPIGAHLFVLYFGMLSMVTPPVAIASFTAATIAGANPWRTAWIGMRLGWIAYVVPFLFAYAPTLTLTGGTLAIAWSIATAVLGLSLVSAAFAGYLRDRLKPAERLLLGVAGLATLVPAATFEGAIWVEAAGLAAGIVLSLVILLRPSAPPDPAEPRP